MDIEKIIAATSSSMSDSSLAITKEDNETDGTEKVSELTNKSANSGEALEESNEAGEEDKNVAVQVQSALSQDSKDDAKKASIQCEKNNIALEILPADNEVAETKSTFCTELQETAKLETDDLNKDDDTMDIDMTSTESKQVDRNDESKEDESGKLVAEKDQSVITKEKKDDAILEERSEENVEGKLNGKLDAKLEDDKAAMLAVMCGMNEAQVHLDRLKQGSKGACVVYEGRWLTPNEFQALSGRQTAKDWKRSIRHNGKTLKWLLKNGILLLEPPGCRCEKCGGTLSIESSVAQAKPAFANGLVVSSTDRENSDIKVAGDAPKKKKKHRPPKRPLSEEAQQTDEQDGKRRIKKSKSAADEKINSTPSNAAVLTENGQDGTRGDVRPTIAAESDISMREISIHRPSNENSTCAKLIGHAETPPGDCDRRLSPCKPRDKTSDDKQAAVRHSPAALPPHQAIVGDGGSRRSTDESPRCVGRKDSEEGGERWRRGEGDEESCSRTSGNRRQEYVKRHKSTSLASPSHNGDRTSSTNHHSPNYSRDTGQHSGGGDRTSSSSSNHSLPSHARDHYHHSRSVDDKQQRSENDRRGLKDPERRSLADGDSDRRGEHDKRDSDRRSESDRRGDPDRRSDLGGPPRGESESDEAAMWRKWFPWLTATTSGVTVPHRLPPSVPAMGPSGPGGPFSHTSGLGTSGPFSHSPGERAFCTPCLSMPWLAHCTCYCAYFPHYHPSMATSRSPTGLPPSLPYSPLYGYPPPSPLLTMPSHPHDTGGMTCSMQDAYRSAAAGYPWSLANVYAGLMPPSFGSAPSPFDLFGGLPGADSRRTSPPSSLSSAYKTASLGLDAVLGKRLGERPLDLSQPRF